MTRPGEMFSIVTIGAMNPAIHYPGWYETLGLLSKEETQRALKNPAFVMGSDVAQFTLGTLSIFCIHARWHVATTDEAEIPRILRIAKATHSALPHTPVNVIGINFDFCRPSDAANVAAFLGREIHGLRIGVGEGVPTSGQVIFTRKRNAGNAELTTNITIAPGGITPGSIAIGPSVEVEPSAVLVKYNVELRVDASVGHYDMGPLLDEHVPPIEAESRAQLERTLAAFARAKGG